jgi:hypothetical protein
MLHPVELKELFVPGRPIRSESQLFAGRQESFLYLLDGLAAPGSSIFLFGPRGIGKTSLAFQVSEWLQGNTKTWEKFSPLLPPAPGEFACAWIHCNSYMANFNDAILSCLLPSESLRSLADQFPQIYLKISSGLKRVAFDSPAPPDGRAVNAALHEYLAAIRSKQPHARLIIFVDNLESIRSLEGLDEAVKGLETVQFVLIGAFFAPPEPMLPSLQRSLTFIELPALRVEEIGWLLNNAQKLAGGNLTFSPDILELIWLLTAGFPFLIQGLAFHAVRLAADTGPGSQITVNDTHVLEAIRLYLPEDIYRSPAQDAVDQILQSNKDLLIEILELVASSGDSCRLPTLTSGVSPRGKSFLRKNLADFERLDILRTLPSGRISFADPVLRLRVASHLVAKGRWEHR